MPSPHPIGLQPLSGSWRIALDPGDTGRGERWFLGEPGGERQDTLVPGSIQQVFPGQHGVAWYWRTFAPARLAAPGERALLRFHAVDYLGDVWLNGQYLGGHEGGETPFSLDATDALRHGENLLAVRVLNPTDTPIDGIVLEQTPHRNQDADRGLPPRQPAELRRDRAARGVLAGAGGAHHRRLRAPGSGGPGEIDGDRDGAQRYARPRQGGGAIWWPARRRPHEVLATAAAHPDRRAGARRSARRGCSCRGIASGAWTIPISTGSRVRATARGADGTAYHHEQAVRCGFRDFRVVDGYFRLNGKRLFLRSTHTGNHFPSVAACRTTTIWCAAI